MSEAPSFGAFSPMAAAGNPNAKVKYLMANVGSVEERLQLEAISNAAMRSGGSLLKTGDVFIIREDTHFDREGNYVVALKYLEVVAPVPVIPQVEPVPTPSKADEIIARALTDIDTDEE